MVSGNSDFDGQKKASITILKVRFPSCWHKQASCLVQSNLLTLLSVCLWKVDVPWKSSSYTARPDGRLKISFETASEKNSQKYVKGSVLLVVHFGFNLFKSAWFYLDPPWHLCIFSSQSLRRVVEKADFKNLAISTTIRWYDTTFIRSKCIYYKGQCFVNSRQPRTTRLWARGMQFTESAILRLKPDIGEELILITEK